MAHATVWSCTWFTDCVTRLHRVRRVAQSLNHNYSELSKMWRVCVALEYNCCLGGVGRALSPGHLYTTKCGPLDLLRLWLNTIHLGANFDRRRRPGGEAFTAGPVHDIFTTTITVCVFVGRCPLETSHLAERTPRWSDEGERGWQTRVSSPHERASHLSLRRVWREPYGHLYHYHRALCPSRPGIVAGRLGQMTGPLSDESPKPTFFSTD
jgi:hypothetical protein